MQIDNYHSRPIAIAMFASYDPPYFKKKASDISKKTYGKCSEGITYCYRLDRGLFKYMYYISSSKDNILLNYVSAFLF